MAHTLNDSDEIISGINVTPLVDVVLVVLIIFIVTASVILRSNVPVELPRAQTAEESTSGLLNVGITRQGQIFINGQPAALDSIGRAVAEARRASVKQGQTVNAFVSADVGAAYGLFAQVVDRLRLEGVTSIALDTQPVPVAASEGRR